MVGPASFVSSNYHAVFAARNGTKTTSSSSSSSSTNNSTSPIGSSTFIKVITKVENTKGGTKKPSDFTITVTGKSPSPKSFSGSSSGTSVMLKPGKYKVTGSGPFGYNIAYSSGCSGTASGGVPIKCTISPSFSRSNPSITTQTNGTNPETIFDIYVFDKANCNTIACPPGDEIYIKVYPRFSSTPIAEFNGPLCGAGEAGCALSRTVGWPGILYGPSNLYTIKAGFMGRRGVDWTAQEADILPQQFHAGSHANCVGKWSCDWTLFKGLNE